MIDIVRYCCDKLDQMLLERFWWHLNFGFGCLELFGLFCSNVGGKNVKRNTESDGLVSEALEGSLKIPRRLCEVCHFKLKTTEVKSLLLWGNPCWSAGAGESAVIKRRPAAKPF